MTKQKYIQIGLLISPSRVQQPIFGYSNLGYLCLLHTVGFDVERLLQAIECIIDFHAGEQ